MHRTTCKAALVFAASCGVWIDHAAALLRPLLEASPKGSSLPLPPDGCGRRAILVDAPLAVAASAGLFQATTTTAAAAADSPAPDIADPFLSVESASRLGSLEGRLRRYPDPALRNVASPVRNALGSSELDGVVDLLSNAMVGNATTAVQYGIDARIVVLRGDASPEPGGGPLVLVNPSVLARSGEDKMLAWREHCGVVAASPPAAAADRTEGLLGVDLLRDAVVEVAAQDPTGRPVRRALSGEAARAFQHELDHLNGILVVDHASLDELPAWVAELEAPFHRARQKRAFARTVYGGNGPLYW